MFVTVNERWMDEPTTLGLNVLVGGSVEIEVKCRTRSRMRSTLTGCYAGVEAKIDAKDGKEADMAIRIVL